MESEGNLINVSRQVEPRMAWEKDEDALLIQLRSSKCSWEKIVGSFPGRSAASCRIRRGKSQFSEQDNFQLYIPDACRLLRSSLSYSITSWTVAELNHWCIGRGEMAKRAGEEFLSEAPVDLPQLEAKNYNAHVQSQQQYQEQGVQAPKNSPWSGDEEAILLAKHREGLQWTDISNCLPGRTPNACSSHCSILNSRCEEGWSPELQNEFCKHYDGLKQEMWMHIGETLSVAWYFAEAMHWELGEDGIADRAGVPLICQPAADLTLAPRERGQTTKEWLNVVCE